MHPPALTLLCALALTAAAQGQVTASLTALSGGVATAGGRNITVPSGSDMSGGLVLQSVGVNTRAVVDQSPLLVAPGGVHFHVEVYVGNLLGGPVGIASLITLLSIQNTAPSTALLEITAVDLHTGQGSGAVRVDIGNDGSYEVSTAVNRFQVPVTLGPNPVLVRVETSGQLAGGYGFGGGTVDLRVVPGSITVTQVGSTCSPVTTLIRENPLPGVDLQIGGLSLYGLSHTLLVVGTQPLPAPVSLPGGTCSLVPDPLIVWWVPQHPTPAGLDVRFDVPVALRPVSAYVQVVDFVIASQTALTGPTWRIDFR